MRYCNNTHTNTGLSLQLYRALLPQESQSCCRLRQSIFETTTTTTKVPVPGWVGAARRWLRRWSPLRKHSREQQRTLRGPAPRDWQLYTTLQDHTGSPVARQNISRPFVLVASIFTAEECLQGWHGTEPRLPLLARLFCSWATAMFTDVQRNPSQRWNTFLLGSRCVGPMKQDRLFPYGTVWKHTRDDPSLFMHLWPAANSL